MQNHRLLRGVLRLLCAFADYLLLMLPVQLVLLFWIGTNALSADFLFRLLFAVYGVLMVEYNQGATLGKMLGRLKVVDRAGGKPAVLYVGLRELIRAMYLIPIAGWAAALVFSVPAGLGTAFLYPAIQSCAQKWYQGRKGFATGVIGAAAGLSGAFLTLFVRTLAPRWGIRGVFGALGALSLPVCLAGAALLTDPPAAAAAPGTQKGPDVPPAQMLRTRQYWLCTAAVCLSTPAVLLFSPIILRLGAERGLAEGEAVWAVVLGSAGSTAGRLLMPLLSDKIGRRPTDLLLFGASAGLSAGFAFAQGWAVAAVYAGLTFCYSALAAVLPAFSTDRFGLPHAGVNYGFLALGQSAGSLLFPLLAEALGLEAGRHLMAVGAAAGGFACIWFLKPAGEKTPKMENEGQKRQKRTKKKNRLDK